MGVGRRCTTAEAVAYERARPLKRPGERGSGGGSRRELVGARVGGAARRGG